MNRQGSKTIPKTRRKKVELKPAVAKTALATTAPKTAVPATIVSVAVGLDAFKAIAQSSLDAIPTGFCVCKADCSLVRYNKRAAELWGQELPLGEPAARYNGDLRRYRPDGAPLHFASTPVAQ